MEFWKNFCEKSGKQTRSRKSKFSSREIDQILMLGIWWSLGIDPGSQNCWSGSRKIKFFENHQVSKNPYWRTGSKLESRI